MAREDFVKREHTVYGHTYGITEHCEYTKDGVVCGGAPKNGVKVAGELSVKLDVNGRLRMFDKNNAVGFIKEDFGYYSNTTRPQEEVIGESVEHLTNGNVKKTVRTVYRTPEKGMYCEDVVRIYAKDGATLVEDLGRRPAPFEVLK